MSDKKIHAAGCEILEEHDGSTVKFYWKMLEFEKDPRKVTLHRRRIDYAELHCILVNRAVLPDTAPFDILVEPIDLDFGLTLRLRHIPVFFEPASIVGYYIGPPLRMIDVDYFLYRWDDSILFPRMVYFTEKWKSDLNVKKKQRLYVYRRRWVGFTGSRHPHPIMLGLANIVYLIRIRLQSSLKNLLSS